ncbi:MAG: DUF192 domain-containing protein [Chloroflexi bacterium]|nr:DUF192 domain-containing protein [Chloroflexota bacterium]
MPEGFPMIGGGLFRRPRFVAWTKVDRYVNVRKQASGEALLCGARWCESFLGRLRGLMLRAGLREGEALILVEAQDTRSATSIHMFFVPFAIAAVWVDSSRRVVDKVVARPWRPFYASRTPARYVLEAAPDFLDKVSLGDELVFEDCPPPAGR